MNDLPAGLAEPLHYFDFDWKRWLTWVATLLVLTLLVWWWSRRRRRPEPVAESVAKVPAPVALESGIAEQIRQIRQQFDANKDYRGGCHELAELSRRFFSGRLQSLETLTAREIEQLLDGQTPSRLFASLAGLQFRRRAPSRDEFVDACQQAKTTMDRPDWKAGR